MAAINAKKIAVKNVTLAYDLALGYFTSNPDKMSSDATPADFVENLLSMKLTEINYPRAANLPSVIKSHEAKRRREGTPAAQPAEACDMSAAIFNLVTGVELERPAPTADLEAASAVATATETPLVARSTAKNFKVADDSEVLINAALAGATQNRMSSITALLAAVETIETAKSKADDLEAAYRAAIEAHKAGDENVDETALVDAEPSVTTGYAGTATASPMTVVLDDYIKKNITPETSFADLVARITEAETALSGHAGRIKLLKRELRQVKPKDRVRVSTEGTMPSAAYADTLDEIDEINRDCDVTLEVAADIFPKCYGANPQILGFEVPKLDFGVPHPDVPAIDPTFRFYTGVLVEALSAIADNEIIWLYGDSGCGKSEFWTQVAAYMGMPFTRINLDGHLTRSDIVGGMKLVSDGKGGSETRFVEGALPRAMARPGLLLIDEFDLGDPEIMPIFQPVLEGKPIVLLEDGGRIVKPHPYFRIAITGNTIGLGSDSQMYLNAFEQSAATRDRIAAFVEMKYMPAKIEQEVVMARYPSADTAFVAKLIQLANSVRDGYRSRDLHQLFSTRAVLACVRRHNRFASLYPTPQQANEEILKNVILSRMDDTSHRVVKGLIDGIFV